MCFIHSLFLRIERFLITSEVLLSIPQYQLYLSVLESFNWLLWLEEKRELNQNVPLVSFCAAGSYSELWMNVHEYILELTLNITKGFFQPATQAFNVQIQVF